MSIFAALLVSLPVPMLFGAPLFFPKKWFIADNDADRRVLRSFGKYDPQLHARRLT